MNGTHRALLAMLVLAGSAAAGAHAQGTQIKITEEKPGLLKLAKVTPEQAQTAVRTRFPTAVFKAGEIERENGKLIYSFDLEVPGTKGVEEVHVDGATGKVLRSEHEDPKHEPRAKAGPRPVPKRPPAA